MNKKLVAAAIAGLLAAPLAQAQTANVTLYGRLNMDMEFVKGAFLTPGATQPVNCPTNIATPSTGQTGTSLIPNAISNCITSNPNQYRVSSNSSRFGIRGVESLGGGLNAIFQVENSLSADNSGGTLAGRDTFVGLQGNWGTFKMGYFHLPYDQIHSYIWGSQPTLETGILATSSIWAQGFATKATGCFDCRVGNTIRWDSPNWSGWQTQWSYSIGGGNGSPTTSPTEGTPKSNSSTSSGVLFYAAGPFYFGTGFQYNAQVRQAGLNDWALSVAGAYQFPKVRVGAIYERLDYDCANIVNPLTACTSVPTVTGTTSLTRNFYGVDLTIDIGPPGAQLYFDWSASGNGSGGVVNNARVGGLAKGPNTSANQWEISYTYPLSKRTSLFTGYTQILNKSNANYNFSVNSYPTTFGIPGVKPMGFVAGMWHNF